MFRVFGEDLVGENQNFSCRIKDIKLYRVIVRKILSFAFLIEFVLDESILDLESWLPQSAIDEVVALILHLEEQEENNIAVSSSKP